MSRTRRASSPTIAAAATFGAVALLIACSGRGTVTTVTPAFGTEDGKDRAIAAVRRGHHFSGSSPIQHVFIIIQENRTFDNLFNNYPNANTVQSGLAVAIDSTGKPIPGATPLMVPLQPVGLEDPWDIPHGLKQFITASNKGANDGFSELHGVCYNAGCTPPPELNYPSYSYVPQEETQPYWQMASQYVLADNNFQSNIDASFVAHQYLIAGWADHAVNFPKGFRWGCDSTYKTPWIDIYRQIGGYETPCFTYGTLASALEAAGYDWRYYTVPESAGGPTGYYWSAFDAINSVRNGPEWVTGSDPKVINPPQQVLTDIASGNVPVGVTWVTPWIDDSDHASSYHADGPAWVASVVNAIGSNTQLWNTSAIFVTWDDWGGWYDHVPPKKLDYDGLGFRVPLLIISPYARQNYVTHVPYEFGSILKFVEQNFGLPPVTPSNCCHGKKGSNVRATNPAPNVFNFSGTPRPFVTIPSLHKRDYFIHQRPDLRPVDSE